MATTTPTTKKKKKNPIVLTAPVPNVGGGAVDDLDSYVHANSLQSHFTAKERVDGFLVAGKLYTLGLSAVSMYPNVEAQPLLPLHSHLYLVDSRSCRSRRSSTKSHPSLGSLTSLCFLKGLIKATTQTNTRPGPLFICFLVLTERYTS